VAAGLLAVPLLEYSGAADSIRLALAAEDWQIPVLYVGSAVLAGFAYGAVFQRAAADRRGGWLFGISYGFLLWMLGPITLLQTLLGHPIASGGAAMGILAGNLLSGLILGLFFRPAHRVIRRYLERRTPSLSQQGTPRAAEQWYGR
jgi:hypothetical protein